MGGWVTGTVLGRCVLMCGVIVSILVSQCVRVRGWARWVPKLAYENVDGGAGSRNMGSAPTKPLFVCLFVWLSLLACLHALALSDCVFTFPRACVRACVRACLPACQADGGGSQLSEDLLLQQADARDDVGQAGRARRQRGAAAAAAAAAWPAAGARQRRRRRWRRRWRSHGHWTGAPGSECDRGAAIRAECAPM